MPDDSTRTQAIESRIDRSITGQLAVTGGGGGAMSIAPRNMGEMMEFAKLMSVSGDCVRPAFRGNPGACLGVAMQAFRCGGDPFAWANRAYVTRNNKTGETQIAYEASLIDAQVNTSGILSRRLRLAYEGQGPTRKCIVSGWIKGEGDEPFIYESPMVKDIGVQNSPLWRSDPDQQLGYYSKRAWARRWVPEVLLGIYTTDEIDGQIIDVTADRIDAHAAALQPAQAEPEPWAVYDYAGNRYEFKSQASAAEAFRKVLITAAAQDGEALKTAWDNNCGDDLLLGRISGDLLPAMNRLYDELAPQDSPVSDQPEQKGVVATVADHPLDRTDTAPPKTGDTRAPDEPAHRPAVDSDSHPPAAGPSLTTEPAPRPQNDQRAMETPVADRGGMPPPRDDEHSASPPAAATQTAERHDPFWDRESLAVAVPDDRRGKPDWRGWTALLLPRIRQAWAVPLLNALYEDNRDTLRSYASNLGQRPADEIEAEFDAARTRLIDGG